MVAMATIHGGAPPYEHRTNNDQSRDADHKDSGNDGQRYQRWNGVVVAEQHLDQRRLRELLENDSLLLLELHAFLLGSSYLSDS